MTTIENDLTPSYLPIDYSTLTQRLRTQIFESGKFTDVNYEGSNISILIELFAYISELNTFYLNKLAKNQFIDTADVYENVHRLASLLGYNPKGYVSSSGTINITLSDSSLPGKTLTIEKWAQLKTDDNFLDSDDRQIYFITTESQEVTSETSIFSFVDIPIRQGKILKFNSDNGNAYTYSSIIDNKIILPLYKFDYDDNTVDNYQSIRLFIDGEEWTRIDNFYDNISGLTNEMKVYRFLYNKYGQYYIEFSIYREFPSENSEIDIWLLDSLGANGNVVAGAITVYDTDDFLIDNFGNIIDIDELTSVTITNPYSTTGGSDPETITQVKENTKETVNTQYRNVTKTDYITYLEQHNYIIKANAWGEQDAHLDGGNIYDYNKVFITMIPSDDPVTWVDKIVTTTVVLDNGTTIYIPVSSQENNSYYTSYKSTISEYLEPRKMLCAYEEYVAPSLIYFKFIVSLKIKSNYRWNNVLKDVKRKLAWYFNIQNREFNETVKFTDIINTMLDEDFVNENDSDTFSNTKGITNFVIRDIKYYDIYTDTWIYPYGYDTTYYPRFEEYVNTDWLNELTNVLLDLNQFPVIDINSCEWDQI